MLGRLFRGRALHSRYATVTQPLQLHSRYADVTQPLRRELSILGKYQRRRDAQRAEPYEE
eukprot:COSAG02_NODE_35299_length_470_cov_2.649596_1_plen_59_part_01